MAHFVIGIDQGTTGTLVTIMDDEGNAVASAYQTHEQIYPQIGWVEHDPNELWANVCRLIEQALSESQVNVQDVVGIGIANQGESVLIWDKTTGSPLHNVLVWQDTRAESDIALLRASPENIHEVHRRTGLKLDSYFSASKIHWLLTNVPSAASLIRNNQLACGTLDTWLIWKMTEGRSFVTDVSTASRTSPIQHPHAAMG